MYQTIRLSSCVSVQGDFVEALDDGQIVIRDGDKEYRGRPIVRRSGLEGSPGALIDAATERR